MYLLHPFPPRKVMHPVRTWLDGRVINVRGSVTGDVVAHQRLSVLGSGNVSSDVHRLRLRDDHGTVSNDGAVARTGAPIRTAASCTWPFAYSERLERRRGVSAGDRSSPYFGVQVLA